MPQTVEDIRYQLEEWLAQGFTSPEDRANYQVLKEQYEDETLDYSFSKREIIGQLEVIITTRENDFPDLDEVTKEEYLELVEQLDNLDKGQADYYRKQLAQKEVQNMIEQIIQSLFIIAATGLILLVLYQIAKMLGSLFVIGLIGFLLSQKSMEFTSFLQNDTSMWKIQPPMVF